MQIPNTQRTKRVTYTYAQRKYIAKCHNKRDMGDILICHYL